MSLNTSRSRNVSTPLSSTTKSPHLGEPIVAAIRRPSMEVKLDSPVLPPLPKSPELGFELGRELKDEDGEVIKPGIGKGKINSATVSPRDVANGNEKDKGHKKEESGDVLELLSEKTTSHTTAGVGLGIGLPSITMDPHPSELGSIPAPALSSSRRSIDTSPKSSLSSLQVPSRSVSPNFNAQSSSSRSRSRSPGTTGSSPRVGHQRKGSFGRTLVGAFISREKGLSREDLSSLAAAAAANSGTASGIDDELGIDGKGNKKSGPPPVASKPSWLKRTASAGRDMIVGSSGGSGGSSPSSSPAMNAPPVLPPRKGSVDPPTTSSERAPPPLPKRHGDKGHGTSASVSFTKSAINLPSNNRISLALDMGSIARSSSPLRSPNPTERDDAEGEDSVPDGLPVRITRSAAVTPIDGTGGNAARGSYSMDVPRRGGPVGPNGLTAPNASGLTAGLRSGLGAVNRRIGTWSNENAAAGSAKGYIQAGSGMLGSAVSSGWQAWRKTSTPPPHSSSAGSTGSVNSRISVLGSSPRKSELLADDYSSMGEGPSLQPGLVKRRMRVNGKGEVFGRELGSAAREWPVEVEVGEMGMMTPVGRGKRRRRGECLPAVAFRCADHLRLWAANEEGIFRVSGRSSHVALLRKHFDAGADIELEKCDPGDIDPHAVASLYKSFLRELPTPILTSELAPEFDHAMNRLNGSSAQDMQYTSAAATNNATQLDNLINLSKRDKELTASQQAARRRSLLDEVRGKMGVLLERLPDENWWLLSDLAQLLAWTDQHRSINKMTLQNLLMVFCPSLNLSPPFLRYLIENHRNLFKDLDDPLTPIGGAGAGEKADVLPPTSTIVNVNQKNIILSPAAISLPPTPTTTTIVEDGSSAKSETAPGGGGADGDAPQVGLGISDQNKSLPASPVTPTKAKPTREDIEATPKSNMDVIKEKRRSKLAIPNAFLADAIANNDPASTNTTNVFAHSVSRSSDSNSSLSPRSAGSSPLLNGDGSGFLVPASGQPGERRSATPIADRFRRTGPVEITLREKSSL